MLLLLAIFGFALAHNGYRTPQDGSLWTGSGVIGSLWTGSGIIGPAPNANLTKTIIVIKNGQRIRINCATCHLCCYGKNPSVQIIPGSPGQPGQPGIPVDNGYRTYPWPQPPQPTQPSPISTPAPQSTPFWPPGPVPTSPPQPVPTTQQSLPPGPVPTQPVPPVPTVAPVPVPIAPGPGQPYPPGPYTPGSYYPVIPGYQVPPRDVYAVPPPPCVPTTTTTTPAPTTTTTTTTTPRPPCYTPSTPPAPIPTQPTDTIPTLPPWTAPTTTPQGPQTPGPNGECCYIDLRSIQAVLSCGVAVRDGCCSQTCSQSSQVQRQIQINFQLLARYFGQIPSRIFCSDAIRFGLVQSTEINGVCKSAPVNPFEPTQRPEIIIPTDTYSTPPTAGPGPSYPPTVAPGGQDSYVFPSNAPSKSGSASFSIISSFVTIVLATVLCL